MDGLPGGARLAETLDGQRRLARRAQAAVDLHAVAENLRFLAGADVHSARELQLLEAHCRTAWEARGLVAGPGNAALDADTEEQIRADLLDLALLWAELTRRRARQGEDGEDCAEVPAILAEAEALLGPSAALARERHLLGSASGADGTPGSAPSRRAAWEHVALGQSLLRSGKLEQAAVELERAGHQRPQDFWANFYRGVCAYRQEHYADAVHSFGVAIALAPQSPECYYNRALAYAAWGKNGAALGDYDRALALAPRLGVAALNRGVLHYKEGRFSQALADLEQALSQEAEPATVHYNLALVHRALHAPAAAQQHLEQALHHNPAHAAARSLRERLRQPE